MKTITLMHHTIFADLKEKALDASFDEQYPENGSFVARTIRNKVFWYYKGYTAEGDKQDKYVEPADNQEITMRVEEFRRSKVGYKERRSLVMSLKRVLPSPDPFVGDLIEGFMEGRSVSFAWDLDRHNSISNLRWPTRRAIARSCREN